MHILEAFARTYATVGRLPEPLPTHGQHRDDSAPSISIAAYKAVTAIADAADRVLCAFRRYRVRRATVRDLWALDDHALADIGLSRGAIDGVAGRLVDGDGDPCARRVAANDNAVDIAA
jgi:uncharacterized protein YjiS (DUF1127 family)